MAQILSTPQHHLTTEAEKISAISEVERLINLNEVEFQTGFKSSFIYQLIKEGKFPAPVKIGTASRWKLSEIQAWIQAQIESSTSGKRAGVRI